MTDPFALARPYQELEHDDCRSVEWGLISPERIRMILTDPPYGVEYQSRRGRTHDHDQVSRAIANDSTLDGAIRIFQEAMEAILPWTDDECEMYVFTRWDIVTEWAMVIDNLPGFQYKALLVWDKGDLGMGDIDASWCPSYEFIIYAKKGRRNLNHQRESVLRFSRVGAKQRIHPTEKPVALLEELIKISTSPGDLIVDPFAGSASTLVAAKNLGRSCIGVEYDSERYKLASQRLQQSLFF